MVSRIYRLNFDLLLNINFISVLKIRIVNGSLTYLFC